MSFFQTWGHALLTLFDAHQFPVLFALLFAEADGVFLPIPGDTFLALAATQHPPSLGYALALIGVAIVAVNLGALVLFTIMRRGGRRFIARFGKYFFLNAQRLNRLEQWYRKRGNVAITVGWLIPGARILTAVLAGLANVSYRVYIPFALLGSLLWASAVYGIGTLIYFTGPELGNTLSHVAGNIILLAAVGIILVLAMVNIWHGNHHRRRFSLESLNFLPALEKDARSLAQGVKHEAQTIEKHLVKPDEPRSDRP
jgi:membrane protein DedA with SNARE-associated domain